MKLQFIPVFISLFWSYFSFSQAQNLNHYSVSQLDSIFESRKKIGAYPELLPYAEAVLAKLSKTNKSDTLYARWLYNAAFAYDYGSGNYDKAIPLYEQAIEIQKKLISISEAHANSLSALGDIYNYSIGQYEKAEPLYREALKIREKLFGKEHPSYANSLDNLGAMYFFLGQYPRCEPLYLEAKAIRKKVFGAEHPDYARSLNGLAILYENLGKYPEAEPMYLESTAILQKLLGKEHPDYAQILNNLAGLYMEMERFEEAEPLYIEAKNIKKKIFGTNHQEYGLTLNNLAVLYERMGKYPEAKTLYQEAIEIRKAVYGVNNPYYAQSLNNLGALYQQMKRSDLAEPLFLEAIAIFKKTLGGEHIEYLHAVTNLALMHLENKNYLKAEILFLECNAIWTKIVDIKSHDYIWNLNSLGRLYQEMSNVEKAWDYILQALKANTGLDMSKNITQNWADSLAKAEYASKSDMDATLRCIYVLLEPLENVKNQQIIVANLGMQLLKDTKDASIGTADKLRNLAESNDWALRSLTILDKKQIHQAFELAELSKSVLLADAVKTKYAYTFGDLPDSLMIQEKNLQKEQSDLEAMLLEKRMDTEKDSLRYILNKLNLKIKKFKAQVEKTHPKYAALKYEEKKVSIAEIQSILSQNTSTQQTALLEYVVGDSAIYIFYIDAKNARWAEQKIKKEELNAKVKQLHNALSNYSFIKKEPVIAYKDYTETAFWFYEKLLSPVFTKTPHSSNEKNANEITHLIIIPDGEIGNLPFETFLSERPKNWGKLDDLQQNKNIDIKILEYNNLKYLLNDYRISYNYSALLWKNNGTSTKDKSTPSAKNAGQMLAMASNYDILLDSAGRKNRLPIYMQKRKMLHPLPSAQQEVKILSEQFEGYFGFDKNATEKEFKANAADYSIIHLAMHGLLDNKAPILSSLAFTEDSDSLENNFLQAYEISKMQLNADLVVLSACETGYGKFEKGNGMASLATAFMYAGVPSMVVSLWQVNDFATSEIMKTFYSYLSDGLDKADALRQAKLDYIQKANGILAHPAFWSPFIQLGDNRAIAIRTKGGNWKIGLGLAALVLVLGGAFFASKKKK